MKHYETADGRMLAALTVDAVLIDHDGNVALIRRGKQPFKGVLALIGGHLDHGETFIEAAQRELFEEVGVWLGLECFDEVPGVWDAPDRNPLRRTVGVAFLARLPRGMDRPALKAGDDADDAGWYPVADVLDGSTAVAFDHDVMLRSVWAHRARLEGWKG